MGEAGMMCWSGDGAESGKLVRKDRQGKLKVKCYEIDTGEQELGEIK